MVALGFVWFIIGLFGVVCVLFCGLVRLAVVLVYVVNCVCCWLCLVWGCCLFVVVVISLYLVI